MSSPSPKQGSLMLSAPPTNKPRKFQCATCSKRFTTSGHLSRHSRIHTGERNFSCPYPGCTTKCSRKDNLTQHYRVHLGPGSRTRSRRGSGKASAAPLLLPSSIKTEMKDQPTAPLPRPISKTAHREEGQLYPEERAVGPDRSSRRVSRKQSIVTAPYPDRYHSSSSPMVPHAPTPVEADSSPLIQRIPSSLPEPSPSPPHPVSRSDSVNVSVNLFRNSAENVYDARDLRSSRQAVAVSPPSLALPSLTSEVKSGSGKYLSPETDECTSPSTSSSYSDSSSLLTPDVHRHMDGYFFDHQHNQNPMYSSSNGNGYGGIMSEPMGYDTPPHLIPPSNEYTLATHHTSSNSPYVLGYPPISHHHHSIAPIGHGGENGGCSTGMPLSLAVYNGETDSHYPIDPHSLHATTPLALHHPRPVMWGFDAYSHPPHVQSVN